MTFLGSQEEAGERRFTYSPKLAARTALLIDEEQKLSSNLGCFCFYIEELPECLCVLQSVISRDLWGRLLLDLYLGAACTQSREA